MKKYNLKTLLILLILSSFTIGVVNLKIDLPLVLLEIRFFEKIILMQHQYVEDIIQFTFLIASHWGIISLLFIKNNKLVTILLFILPLVLLIDYMRLTIIILFYAPVFALTLIPFVTFWFLCLNKLRNKQ